MVPTFKVETIYVNMGEFGVNDKGSANSHQNRRVFYASGVDRLARFVDEHKTEIKVSFVGIYVF